MVRPTNFEIQHKIVGQNLTLAITGELDMNTTNTLTQELDQRLEGEITTVTLDLRELGFMDSSGLRVLIALNDRSQAEPWRLALLAPTAEAATVVLRVTGADTALPFTSESDS